MKKKLFLIIMSVALSVGGNVLAFGRELNLYQTNSGSSKKQPAAKQTAAEKKEAKEKREQAEKEAAQKRKAAKTTAKNTTQTGKKKHKKFLGIF